MLSFESDYICGAHPAVLDALIETNLEPQSGYGKDIYCEHAIEKIKKACEAPDADVFFLVGGTQTNQFVISTLLKPYEGVIAAKTGHVSLHEAGAIEYSGHKVIELDCCDGKLSAKTIKEYLETFYNDGNHEQMTFPGMVYISYPTEYGTLYTAKELTDIHEICMSNNIPLFVDGARLGYGLMSKECDLTLPKLARSCEVFYIGGTKVGALCGEAIVFPRGGAPKHLQAQIKQHGALLAKGRLLGIQFDTLFTDNLYFNISRQAIELAEELKRVFTSRGYKLFLNSPTNQQFIILDNDKMRELLDNVCFSFWEKYDDTHTVVRFAVSWSTTRQDLERLDSILDRIAK